MTFWTARESTTCSSDHHHRPGATLPPAFRYERNTVSRIIFISQHGQADLAGFEREALRGLARLVPSTVWGLADAGARKLDRVQTVLSMIPNRPETSYLHDLLAKARAEEGRYHQHYEAGSKTGTPMNQNPARLNTGIIDNAVSALVTALKVRGLPIVINGDDSRVFHLNSMEVEFNTTLKAACDPIRLATKIYGWAETHAWIADTDRTWAADLIQAGLEHGFYRAGIWAKTSAGTNWVDSGWGGIQDFLRGTRGPVALHTSIADEFPNPDMDSWMIPWPDGVPMNLAYLSAEQQRARRHRYAEWNSLTPEQRWEYGVREMTENLSCLQISPATLETAMFGPGVTLFDLFANDRVYRVTSKFAEFEQEFGPWNG